MDLSPPSSDSKSGRSFCDVVRGEAELASSSRAPVVQAIRALRRASVVVPQVERAPAASRLGDRVKPPVTTRLGSRVDSPVDGDGWHLAGKKRPRRSRLSPELPVLASRRDMPPDMAGLCYNCLGDDHVAALCPG